MSIYITRKKKKELESRLEEITQIFIKNDGSMSRKDLSPLSYEYKYIQKLLKEAVWIPIEESWDKAVPDGLEEDSIFEYIQDNYPDGIIIENQ